MPVEATVRIENFEKIVDAFGGVGEAIQKVAEEIAKTLLSTVEGRSPVGDPKTDPHHGQLQRSWSSVTQEANSFSFSTEVPYALILEEGLYKNTGPRTDILDGRIYSKQAMGGMLTPLINDEALIQTLIDGTVERLKEELYART